MTGTELRAHFLSFFREQGHTILPSASLVPEGDPSVLFTTAGMQPLVSYLLGTPHPGGTRLANAQKCLRTDDLELVGDATHLTFFEMLGNWSLGDYFKEEAIRLSFTFLTARSGLALSKDKLAVTCFAGDADAPRDNEAAQLWEAVGIPRQRIFFFGKRENWWGPLGKLGPCGPDTEIFFDTGRGGSAVPNDDSGRFVEIWNNVFMEYEICADGSVRSLPQKNVDTGMGLERAAAAIAGLPSVYETDLLAPLVSVIAARVPQDEPRSVRVVTDHLRAAVFVLSDGRGVIPSNSEHGYVLRRLLRRAFRTLQLLSLKAEDIAALLGDALAGVVAVYGSVYPEVTERQAVVKEQCGQELEKFLRVSRRADTLLERERAKGVKLLSGAEAFALYQETGVHPDLLRSSGERYGVTVDLKGFEEEFARHREVSRAGMARRFAGGLMDHSERTVRLHTATHLLHAALRRVLGPHVQQRGSNITPERTRFDFTHPAKIEPATLANIERLVNEQIERDLPVTRTVMSPAEALASGALGFFGERYGEQVSVYAVGDFSKEICGGPHVARTGAIGRFRLVREEGLAAGIRRIRAVVEDK